MTEILVLVVDDHAILRDGIRSLLDSQADIRVVGEASNGREAVEKVELLHPDIVLMDVAMPEMDGLEATRVIKSRSPLVKILILTQHDDPEFVEPLLLAGASGYVLKRSGGREVLSAIRQVSSSGAFLEPSIARQVLDGFTQGKQRSGVSPAALTERERQVLQLLIRGRSNKEIAGKLNISAKTVSVHRSNLMSKIGVDNRIDLLRYATRHGLVEAE